MDLKQAIRDFLIDDRTLDDAVRNDARIEIRNIVGDNIYDGRRKMPPVCFAITIDDTGGQVVNAIDGPAGIRMPVMDITTWCRDGDGREGLRARLDNALRSLLHQFRGALNDGISVQICNLESEPFSRVIPPSDASDTWTHTRSYSFMFGYTITVPGGSAAAVI